MHTETISCGGSRRPISSPVHNQFTTMRSPLLDLARESLAGDHAAGVDILYPLANLVEYKEPIDDLIEGDSSGTRSIVPCLAVRARMGPRAPIIVQLAVTRY